MKKTIIGFSLMLSSVYATAPVLKKVVADARKHNGTPYVFGGEDIVNGIDCSAFVQKVMKMNGVELPRTAREQFRYGRKIQVPPERLFPADLVFFQTYRPGASHVGIYSDVEGEFIHASSSKGVSEALLTNPWWQPRFLGAKRIFDDSKVADAPKEVVKPKVEKRETQNLRDVADEITSFQKKATFLKKHQTKVKKIHKWVKKNQKLALQVCPELYDYPLKTYLYDTSIRAVRSRQKLKFGSELILIGGSKPKGLLGEKQIAKACVVLPDNNLDLIDSEALSIFPAKGLMSPPCKKLSKKEESVKVRVNRAPLELHFLEYENVFGEIINPVKIKARYMAKNKKLKVIGTVKSGRQAGDYCVEYKGNVYNIYSNNVTKI
ncbi:MAG: C40 family peptidase [Bacteriovoracaceae bacterium]|nr:C40 family peptidase [Bacteriovoracaceae bacterium]